MLEEKKIIVDLLPVLPGGANGGAKPFAFELVRALGIVSPRCRFYLMGSDRNWNELAALESSNIHRINPDGTIRRGILERLFHRGKSVSHQPLGADLMFCPFTGISPYFPDLPVVSVVHDLQFRYYPQFFEAEDLAERESNLINVCSRSRRIICVSEFVRESLHESTDLPRKGTAAIHSRLSSRLIVPSKREMGSVLEGMDVRENRFLLYPSNFWLHKNHRMLLTALGMYLAEQPSSDLKLVCTGNRDGMMEEIKEASEKMGLGGIVILPGFCTDLELACLFQASLGVIFPSLYEGFGLPILEAYAFGKPVLCSNRTSLPEIAGGLAAYFDPRVPEEIKEAIGTLENGDFENDGVAEKRREVARKFGDSLEMGRQYTRIFNDQIS